MLPFRTLFRAINNIHIFGIVVLILAFISSSAALQCFSCRGLNFYDPNMCFAPVNGKTIIEECNKGDVCEHKFIRLDYYQAAIERGCSSNCGKRKYIWTDDFFVHCCDSESLCNSSARLSTSDCILFVTLVFALMKLRQVLWQV